MPLLTVVFTCSDFNYRKLAKAASYVRYNDALFVMTNR